MKPDIRDAMVLAAAMIAEDLLTGYTPAENAVFELAAALVVADRQADETTSRFALELTAGLLTHVPDGDAWNETRGRLWGMRLFAWLTSQPREERLGELRAA